MFSYWINKMKGLTKVTGTINTKKAGPVVEMRASISNAISLASKNGVWPAVIVDHLESVLVGLRQMELNRQQMVVPIQYDPVTLKQKTNRDAQRAEEQRAAEALRAEQAAYAAAVSERGRQQALRDGKTG
jgi:hypothetical protein